MVPILTKKRIYAVKTGTIRKFLPGSYCLRGNVRFWKALIRPRERGDSVSEPNLLRLEGASFVASELSALPKFLCFANDAHFDQRRLFLGQNRRHSQSGGV